MTFRNSVLHHHLWMIGCQLILTLEHDSNKVERFLKKNPKKTFLSLPTEFSLKPTRGNIWWKSIFQYTIFQYTNLRTHVTVWYHLLLWQDQSRPSIKAITVVGIRRNRCIYSHYAFVVFETSPSCLLRTYVSKD